MFRRGYEENLFRKSSFPKEYPATASRPLENIACQVLLAGVFFGGSELLLGLEAPRQWIRSKFKAAGKVEAGKLDSTFWQATCRLVGVLHLLIQIPLATLVIFSPEMATDRIYATTDLSFLVTITSAGYFLYDLYICIFRWEGPAYLLHGVTCSTLFCYAACTGFLHFYAALFLMWELSTPFVYARWFLYNLNLASSKIYILNGLAMLGSFFCARNVLGAFMLVDFFKSSGHELAQPRVSGGMPPYMLWTYRTACVTLSCLNAMWFYKMAKGAIKILVVGDKISEVEHKE